jgi:hypothetical protein
MSEGHCVFCGGIAKPKEPCCARLAFAAYDLDMVVSQNYGFADGLKGRPSLFGLDPKVPDTMQKSSYVHGYLAGAEALRVDADAVRRDLAIAPSADVRYPVRLSLEPADKRAGLLELEGREVVGARERSARSGQAGELEAIEGHSAADACGTAHWWQGTVKFSRWLLLRWCPETIRSPPQP